jgi:transposase
MMSVKHNQAALFSYSINLEEHVRGDNPLRVIGRQIDFGWVRDEVAALYGHNGNQSVDPVVIIKLLFLLFWDNIKSERELMRIVPERLDCMWFLGYGLDEVTPNHSVLSKARNRWGKELFERFFVRTVYQCVKLGLVEGKKIHVDSSLVDANAARTSMLSASKEVVAALRKAYAVEESKFEIGEEKRRTTPMHRLNFSKTDPDATLVARDPRSAYAAARPRYKSHRAVDDQCGVITAVQTTPGHIRDGNCLPELVGQHQHNSGTAPSTVIGDQHYGTRENFTHLQSIGIATHMKPLRSKGMSRKHEVFHVSEFIYTPQADTFRCPGGKSLTKRGYNKNEQGWYYRADTQDCANCPLRARCTKTAHPAHTRLIVRPDGHEALLKGWAQAESEEASLDRRRRMTLIEGGFGQAAQNHHFKRSRYRRLWRQSIQDHLIAAVQNIKKIIKHVLTSQTLTAISDTCSA